tara:strand:- start:75 stop:305 length:231 start_codon:yes stop_codon:yes gene_type:complete
MEYAWFSQKQFDKKKELDNLDSGNKYGWIYWKLKDGNIVLISEITSSKKYSSRFDDVIYLGECDEFYGVFNEEQSI